MVILRGGRKGFSPLRCGGKIGITSQRQQDSLGTNFDRQAERDGAVSSHQKADVIKTVQVM